MQREARDISADSMRRQKSDEPSADMSESEPNQASRLSYPPKQRCSV